MLALGRTVFPCGHHTCLRLAPITNKVSVRFIHTQLIPAPYHLSCIHTTSTAFAVRDKQHWCSPRATDAHAHHTLTALACTA